MALYSPAVPAKLLWLILLLVLQSGPMQTMPAAVEGQTHLPLWVWPDFALLRHVQQIEQLSEGWPFRMHSAKERERERISLVHAASIGL